MLRIFHNYRKTSFLFFVLLFSSHGKAQVLFNIGEYRNMIYVSSGYNGSFTNITTGVGRRDYIKLIKREVVGVLDGSFHVSDLFFTRYSIRKGIQFDLYQKDWFRLPFMFASTSIVRHDKYLKLHDITAELSIAPGIYKKNYTLALDCRYEFIAFRFEKYTRLYHQQINNDVHTHWEYPHYSIGKIGVFAGINLKQFTFYTKFGYERNPFSGTNYLPGYVLLGVGYKCGTKPFKK